MPRIIIFHEPTNRLAVGVIAGTHALIGHLADEHPAVIVISSYRRTFLIS
jgi:ABC-type sugar transport system ATPase subunit